MGTKLTLFPVSPCEGLWRTWRWGGPRGAGPGPPGGSLRTSAQTRRDFGKPFICFLYALYIFFFLGGGLILTLLIFQFQGALLLSNGNSILCSVELQSSQKLDILSCKHRYLCLRVTAQLLFKVTRLGLNAIRFVLKVTINLKSMKFDCTLIYK